MKMKPHSHEMAEGPEAFDRFRKAMKAIISVKKADVVDPPKPARKKRPSRKG